MKFSILLILTLFSSVLFLSGCQSSERAAKQESEGISIGDGMTIKGHMSTSVMTTDN